MVLRNRVQDETVAQLEDEVNKTRLLAEQQTASLEKQLADKTSDLQMQLDKAESYVEQGRAMINAVMDRWYEYDGE